MIEGGGGGYLKNIGAISRGPEKIWNKKQFLLHSPLQLKLWLVPKHPSEVGGPAPYEGARTLGQSFYPREFLPVF